MAERAMTLQPPRMLPGTMARSRKAWPKCNPRLLADLNFQNEKVKKEKLIQIREDVSK
jgi:hypothetical protein